MECPVCNIAMQAKKFGRRKDIELDVCPQCLGTWLDAGELNQLDECEWSNIEQDTKFLTVDSPSREVKCPKCQIPLQPQIPEDYQAIEVDRCSQCQGFWLDSGEMRTWLLSRVL